MPKYGLLTKPTKDVVDEINKISKMGFDYAEICIEEPFGTPKILRRKSRQIVAAIKRNKIFAIGHTAYWVGFGSEHPHARKGWVNEAKDMIDVSAILGIKLLNFHFYPGSR